MPRGYETPPKETFEERKVRLQKIKRHWAKEWYFFRYVMKEYSIKFTFKQPWADLYTLGTTPRGQTIRPPLPEGKTPHPMSLDMSQMYQ
jgi:hypothetical protein